MKHFLVYVRFDPNGREYAYLADDESILPGDQVIVPAGIEHEEKAVIVSRTCYVTEKESPYPIKWMKKVLRKIADHPAGDLISKDAPGSGTHASAEEGARGSCKVFLMMIFHGFLPAAGTGTGIVRVPAFFMLFGGREKEDCRHFLKNDNDKINKWKEIVRRNYYNDLRKNTGGCNK